MKTIQELKAGDAVYVSRMSRSFFSPIHYYKATFVKATPGGQVTVTLNGSGTEVRFNKKGREVGADGSYCYELELDVEKIEKELSYRAAHRDAKDAAVQVAKVADKLCGSMLSPEAILQLLDEVQAAVGKARDAADHPALKR